MSKNKLILISAFMIFLIISLPITFAREISLTYDKNGNLITGDGKYRVYNSLNQLWKIYNGTDTTGVLLEDYTYHPTEERVLVKKVYNNDSTLKETVYYINENFVRIINSSGSYDFTYVKHEGQLIAQQNPDSSKYFIHTDHLGSTSVVTDSSGTVVENTTYSPFGEVLTGGESSRYQYEAKEFDSVIGDYDFHFRKYKPEWALFTQPDTLIQNVYDPQTLNRYAFERGNPYKNTDPNGHWIQAVGYAALIVWQFGDVVGYTGLTLGYTYMAIRFSGEGYGEKAWSSLQSAGMSVIPEALVALPKGWISLPGDVKEFSEDWKEAHDKDKKDKDEETKIQDIKPGKYIEQSNQQANQASTLNQQNGMSSNSYTRSGGSGGGMSYSQWINTAEGKKAWQNTYTKIVESLKSKGWSPGGKSSSKGKSK